MTRGVPRGVAATTAVGFLLLHLPVVVLAAFSFNDSRYGVHWTGFTFAWYRELLRRPDILAGMRASLIVGLGATLVATVLGTLLALGLRRRARSGALQAVVALPIMTPEIVAGIGLLALFSALGWTLGIATITIAHVAFCIPFVVLVVQARLAGMDRSLEEAALTLGADEASTFVRVTLPQLWPGIIAGALLAFTVSIDDFVITFFVSGPGSSTLPLVIYGMARRTVDPSINAVSTLLVAASTVLIVVSHRLEHR